MKSLEEIQIELYNELWGMSIEEIERIRREWIAPTKREIPSKNVANYCDWLCDLVIKRKQEEMV